jgi:PAS domain S-box-containing protein
MLKSGPASSRSGQFRLPLLAKMMALLLPVVIVPLIILGVVSIRRSTDAIEQTAQQTLQVIASTAGARLDQELLEAQKLQVVVATTETVVRACSAPPARRKALLPGVEKWFREVLSSDPDLELVYLADEQGICIVSTSPNMVGRDYKATREYMRRALGGENNISDLAIGITTREPGIFFSGPVRDQNNRVAGAVVLKLRGKVIDRVSHEVSRQTEQGFAVVIDANGVIISHPDPKGLYHSVGTLSPEKLKQIDPKLQYGVDRIESAGLDDLANSLRQGQHRGYLTYIGIDGLPKVAGYTRMTQRPWTVAVVQPRSQFDQPMSDLASAQRWWISAMALLAAFGAVWITYSLLRPIRALGAAATKAADGDWSARAAVYSNDELGDLANTFNAMMPALQERSRIEEDLRLANEVQHRTQEHAEHLLLQKEALAIAEERVRQILESAAEGIFGVDTEGMITFVNPSVSRMLGFTAEEMIGKPSHQLIHHHHKDGSEYKREDCPMYAAYTHGKTSRLDDEFLWRKDGSGMPAEYGATPIWKDGKVVGAVISFLNVTLRKKMEIELKEHMADLERFNRLVIGREEKMIQLKEEINGLLKKMGQEAKYKIPE